MNTFLDFHLTLLGFVLYRLYTNLGLHYPPPLDEASDEAGIHLASVVLEPIKLEEDGGEEKKKVKVNSVTADEAPLKSTPSKQSETQRESEEKLKNINNIIKKAESKQKQADQKEEDVVEEGIEVDLVDGNADLEGKENKDNEEKVNEAVAQQTESDMAEFAQKEQGNKTFEHCVIFLSREVPQHAMEFIIRSAGGVVSWQGKNAPLLEKSDTFTHQLVDRKAQTHTHIGRDYVQPQWVVDSLNEQHLLAVDEYRPGMRLPAHLSPFVDDYTEGHIPQRRKELDKDKEHLKQDEEEEVKADEEMV
jgi:pescadillo protein